jgi:hypothetical protein
MVPQNQSAPAFMVARAKSSGMIRDGRAIPSPMEGHDHDRNLNKRRDSPVILSARANAVPAFFGEA